MNGGYDDYQAHGRYEEQYQQEQGYGHPQPAPHGYAQDNGYGGEYQDQNGYAGGYQDPRQQQRLPPQQQRPPPQAIRQHGTVPRGYAADGNSTAPTRTQSDSNKSTQSAPGRPNGAPTAAAGAMRPGTAQGSTRPSAQRVPTRERILPEVPKSPETMAWDNPFGSFPSKAANKHKPAPPPKDEAPGPSTAHPHRARRSNEMQRPPDTVAREHRPQQSGHPNGHQDLQSRDLRARHAQTPSLRAPEPLDFGFDQSQQDPRGRVGEGPYSPRDYGHPGRAPRPPALHDRGPDPGQYEQRAAPPQDLRDPRDQQYVPNARSPPAQAAHLYDNQRSNAMPAHVAPPSHTAFLPAELPAQNFHTPSPSTFSADMPFREGRAQTPVHHQGSFAEPQSAVVETAYDDFDHRASAEHYPPAPAAAHHQTNGSMNANALLPPPMADSRQNSGYSGIFDHYYNDSQRSSAAHSRGPSGETHGADADMPNFEMQRADDELHLDSPVPRHQSQDRSWDQRQPYGQPHNRMGVSEGRDRGASPLQQDPGFDFGTSGGAGGQERAKTMPGNASFDAFEARRAASGPGPGQVPQTPMSAGLGGVGRGMPLGAGPGRGGLPGGRGGYPGQGPVSGPGSVGRGGPMVDRSVSAGGGSRPNQPYAAPSIPGGQSMPSQRGRGMPTTYGGVPGSMPPGGRGALQNPEVLSSHPTPIRPGLIGGGPAPIGGQAQPPKPPPVRQYNGAASNAAPTVTSTSPAPVNPSAALSSPVTIEEIQRLRQAVADRPSDHATSLSLVKKLVEASNTAAIITEHGRVQDSKTKLRNRERYVNDAYKLTKKLVGYNDTPSMFYLAEAHGSGALGLAKDPKEAFLLYQSAAKLGHAPSAYRVAVCCEMGQDEGGGTKRDPLKAVQWYRRAATLGDLPAMYKLGVILLKGLLGQSRSAGEAVSWLERAAERADADNPHALHELGLLYEPTNGAGGRQDQAPNIIADAGYALQLFSRAAALNYKYALFRLGQCYEYGQLGLAIDARQSIAWYSKAAVQEEHQSELALSGWYLTGTEGIIQQSDTEAYLWARKAAQAGLAKAEYAMGYFTESGIGCAANLEDAKRWYWRASGEFSLFLLLSFSPLLLLHAWWPGLMYACRVISCVALLKWVLDFMVLLTM